jgi:cobalt-zinc-cadmium efflux system membrane fusion protein
MTPDGPTRVRRRVGWRRAVVAVALKGAVLVAMGCQRGGRRRAATAAAEAAPAVVGETGAAIVEPERSRGIATARARAAELSDYLELPARIQADPTRVVRVYAPVSGRVLSVAVRPAEHVEQGQVLAILASADLAQAEAAYRQAQADAQVKQQALERARALYEHHVVALRDYQQAQADAQSAAAALASARERLELLHADPDSATDELLLRAPRAGIVTDVNAAAGELAKSLDNATPLCVIADLSTVWAVGDVYETDLARIRVGDAAQVTTTAYPDEQRQGTVTAVGSGLDTLTHTLKVRVVLANPGLRLKPNMFATIRVARERRAAVVVPEAAVLREAASAYVYVQTSPGHFVRRAVVLGRQVNGGEITVLAGIAPGDAVVTVGAELLRAAAGVP